MQQHNITSPGISRKINHCWFLHDKEMIDEVEDSIIIIQEEDRQLLYL